MAVKIRLRRMGKRNAPSHRVVVTDSRSPRDGRFIEVVGFYNPRLKQEKIDLERVDHWISRGAQPSETVDAIIKRARAGISFGGKPTTAESSAEPAAAATEETAPAAPEEAVTAEEVEEAAAPEAAEETGTEESSADSPEEPAQDEAQETESAENVDEEK